ncbi:Hypothetical predicted protein [Podarcis lilfordi]|uniref:Uncharacterized protein n=1 Tax=Podarcis lilfordi TaxID=74358 RepID=A0AA35JVR1_9SAUR|nr:Hypothetical predicted protein [Podarcis lilfordi]
MAVFLKAILTICLLVEIISTTPLKQLGKFKREVQKTDKCRFQRKLTILQKRLITECENLEKSSCGNEEIRKIRFEPHAERTCKTYGRVFCQVNEALKNVSQSACNSSVSNMLPPDSLYEDHTNCTLPNIGSRPMKEFCPALLDYVRSLYVCYVDKKKCTS